MEKFFSVFPNNEVQEAVLKSKEFTENFGRVMVVVGMYAGRLAPWMHFLFPSVHVFVLLYTAYYSIVIEFDFGLFAATMHYALMVISVCSSIVNSQLRSGHLEAMVRQLECGLYKYCGTIDPETESLLMKEKIAMKKRKKRLAIVFFWQFMAAAGISMAVFPVIFKVPKKADSSKYLHRNLPVVAWYPMLLDTWPSYIWMLLTEYWIAFVIIVVLAGTDIPFLCYSEEGLYQLKAVGYSIRHVFRRARYLYQTRYGVEVENYQDPRFSQCLDFCMKDSVKHHYEFLRYFQHLKKLYYYILLIILLGSSLLLCISGIVFVANNIEMKAKLQFFCYLVVVLCHTFIFAWYGEAFLQTNEQLRQDLYNSKWEDCSQVLHKYILILQAYMSQPVALNAGGFMEVNLNTFSSVGNFPF